MGPVGGHGVGGGDGAEGYGAFVCALVAHYAYALDGEEYHSGLPDLVVESGVAEALDEDVVGILEDAYFLGGDVAEDADGETRAREGMAGDEVFGHAECAAHGADLVLEEEAEGLAEAELHALGEAADVVVALDYGSGDGEGLDAVGVYCALGEPADVLNLAGFLVEDLDEVGADDLSLSLGVGDALEVAEEAGGGVDSHDVEAEALVVAEDGCELVLAEHSVVDEYAGEAGTDGTVEEHGGYGGVDASAEAEDDLVVAELSAEFGHGGVDEALGGPGTVRAADSDGEVAEELEAALGVVYLGVELYAPHAVAVATEGGEADFGRGGDAAEAFGEGGDGVAVAHPYLCPGLDAGEEGVGGVDGGETRAAVLAGSRGLDIPAEGVGHELGAVADAEEGIGCGEALKVDAESLLVVDAEGGAREDNADNALLLPVGEFVVG